MAVFRQELSKKGVEVSLYLVFSRLFSVGWDSGWSLLTSTQQVGGNEHLPAKAFLNISTYFKLCSRRTEIFWMMFTAI